MTPSQLKQAAGILRRRYAPPVPTMTPAAYVSHETVRAFADALVEISVDEANTRTARAQRPSLDDDFLRREALDAAVRSQRGPETGPDLVARADALLAFLRGGEQSSSASAVPKGDLDALQGLIGFIRERTFEDTSGLRSLEGEAVLDEARLYLADQSYTQLRLQAHVVASARALVVAELNRRSA